MLISKRRNRASQLSGSLGGLLPQGPPEIRTCGFPASGSSCYGFAERLSPLTPSAARFAIRWSYGVIRCEFRASCIVPPSRSVTWPPLPSIGSLQVGSPTSSVLWATPTSEHPSHRTLFLRATVPLHHSYFRSHDSRVTKTRAWGLSKPASPFR